MARQLYVTSKAFPDGTRLIGILSEANGEYQFEYKLGGYIPEWFLVIDEFPDVSKRYNGSQVEKFVKRIIPKKDGLYINELLEGANLKEYETWEMLKVFGLRNMREDAYLHETLPEGAIIYEELEAT